MEKLDAHFWENRYITNTIGWDLGKVSKPLKAYFDQLTDKNISILIPGGGNAHEAEYLHNQGFENVFVNDITTSALENLKNRVPTFPEKNLLHSDFFNLNQKFDLIIEQTFFCALNPKLRPDYAKQIHHLLKANGKLVGVLFNIPFYKDHPPFGGDKEEYLAYFQPYFKIKTMEACYNSVENRNGKELFINMIRS